MKFAKITSLVFLTLMGTSSFADVITPTNTGLAAGAGAAGGIMLANSWRKEILAVRDRELRTIFLNHEGADTRSNLPTTRNMAEGDHITIEYRLSNAEASAERAKELELQVQDKLKKYHNYKLTAEQFRDTLPDSAATADTEAKLALAEAEKLQAEVEKLRSESHPGVSERTAVKEIEITREGGVKAVDEFLNERIKSGARITTMKQLPGAAWAEMQKLARFKGAIIKGGLIGLSAGAGFAAYEAYSDSTGSQIKKDAETYTPKRGVETTGAR